MRQVAFTAAQLLALPFGGRSAAAIHGARLAYQNGWVQITLHPRWRVLADALVHLQPVVVVPLPDGEDSAFFTRTGLDPDRPLASFINQNGHPVIRGTRHGLPCVIHYGRAPASRASVRRHTRGLADALTVLGPALPGLLPSVYLEHDGADCALVIQQELSGKPAPVVELSEQQLDQVTRAALVPLQAVHRAAVASSDTFDTRFIDEEMAELLAALPEYRDCIEPALTVLRRWISQRPLPCVPAHADYAPRNLLFDAALAQVVGIVDWEWFWGRGCAGFDALQLVLEVHAAHQQRTLTSVLAAFLGGSANDPFLATHLAAVREMFGLSPDDLWHIAILIWLRVLWMGCVETDPSTAQWLEDAVTKPARAIAATQPAA
jgi:hypothetical protein